jgi:hypothetical protein
VGGSIRLPSGTVDPQDVEVIVSDGVRSYPAARR